MHQIDCSRIIKFREVLRAT